MDSIGDFITIIRNASSAHKSKCSAQWSKLREAIAHVLKKEGYISGYKLVNTEKGFKALEVELKYIENEPVIRGIARESKPGCRLYRGYREIPRVLDGLGIAVLSTPKGVVSDRTARREKVGGEHLCNVW